MTLDEAIEELGTLFVPRDGEQDRLADAQEMAIKSLEAWEKVKSDIAERAKHLDEHKQEDLRELVGLLYALSVVVEHLQEVSE